jgi:hypothetical protein
MWPTKKTVKILKKTLSKSLFITKYICRCVIKLTDALKIKTKHCIAFDSFLKEIAFNIDSLLVRSEAWDLGVDHRNAGLD